MGGTDSLKGFDYQITFCILKILELIIQDIPNSTEFIFESINEDEEDFNILHDSHSEFIQIKKRIEGNHWTLSDLKDVFSKFLQKGDSLTKFHFITNGTGNPDVIKLKKAISSISKPEDEMLEKITPNGKTHNQILNLLKSTQISTRFGITDDDDDPAKKLRDECYKLLNKYPFKLIGSDLESIYNFIWKIIFDYSREGKRVNLETLKNDFAKSGLKIEKSPWTTQIQIDDFIGRKIEIKKLQDIFHSKQVLCINGINGIGKTWTTAKLLNETNYLEKTCWIAINQWTTIEHVQFIISSFLFNQKKNFLANKVNTSEKVHQIPAILESLQEFEYVLVFDSLNSGNDQFRSFIKELIKSTVENKIKAKIILSSTESIFKARSQEEKFNFQEFDLIGFELEETKIILSELSEKFTEDEIIKFHNSIGGHPMSIYFLKDLYLNHGIDEKTKNELGQKSIEECRDYILEKSIMILDDESKNQLFSLSIFNYEISWEQCEAQIESMLSAKTALFPLLTKRLLLNSKSGVSMHDSIRAVCQSIISVSSKKKLLKKAIDYIFDKMQSELDGPEGVVLYKDMAKWSDLLSDLHSIQSTDQKYQIIFELDALELDALWAIRRYGYPFDYETEDLTSSQSIVNDLIKKGYVKENDDPDRIINDKKLLYDLINLDYWQECLISSLCLSREISNHMGYIPIFKENHAFFEQSQICWWEHCIEFMPLPPVPRSERIEHQRFVKQKFENGDYNDKTEDQLEFLLKIINEKLPDDLPEENDIEMEERSCPIFGHCCPGGKEQAQECRKYDEKDE